MPLLVLLCSGSHSSVDAVESSIDCVPVVPLVDAASTQVPS